jgi:hypothetical protein
LADIETGDTTLRARLADATARAAGAAAAKVRTSIPVEIVSYDPTTTTARIRQAVREPVQTEDGLVYADALDVPGVPVAWPGVGDDVLTWPLPAGSIVTALVRDRSCDEVDAGADLPSTPASLRRWSWADAMVLPFAVGRRNPLPASATVSSGILARLSSGAALRVGDSTAAQALALAQETAGRLSAIESVINALTLPVSGATAGPPTPIPFPTPTTAADIQTTRILVDGS